MPNENAAPEPMEQPAQKNSQVQDTAPQAQDPQDLSDAFKFLRGNEQGGAEEPVAPEHQEGTIEEPASDNVQPETGSVAGGFANGSEAVDYSSYARGLLDETAMQASKLVAQEFASQDIKKFSTQMLYQRDENTGEVTFVNPESPSTPFKSRTEAQAWCDSINADIEAEFNKAVQQKQHEIIEEIAPTLRLLQFAPVFDSMSELEQEIFDDIIEGYEVYNDSGEVIGYNCDLNSAAKQAQRFAKKYGGNSSLGQVVNQENISSGPAVDMKSSSTSAQGKADLKDPKDLGEAMALLKNLEKGKK